MEGRYGEGWERVSPEKIKGKEVVEVQDNKSRKLFSIFNFTQVAKTPIENKRIKEMVTILRGKRS